MFGTIRKHQSWLWFVIIGVTCLSMVIYFQPGGKNGNQIASGDFGSIDNKPVTATEKQNTLNETALMYFMRTRQWPDSAGASKNFDLERETYQRLFLLRRLNDYNIHADPDTAAQLGVMILRELGNGQSVPLDEFVDRILKPHNMTAEDFQRFLEHDVAIQQLISVVGASGKLVTPAEIQYLYVEENQELAADAVFFSASNYLAKIQEPTPEALGQFYTNQMAAYREPDKMQVTYVFFNVTNFTAQAEQQLGTNLNRMVEDNLNQLGTNIARLGKSPEEARAKIRELLIEETAGTNAYAKAITFQNEVIKEPVKAENLASVAKEKGLEAKVTKPFEKEYGPTELNLDSSFPVASLFNLSSDEPFAGRPIRGTDGVYVIAFDKLIPSRIPPLSEIHDRVVSDFKYTQAMRLAQVNGQSFSQTATNELAHGKTFAATCKETGVKPVELPPFSLSSQRMPEVEDHVDIGTFKEVALGTPVGGASGFVPTRGGGFVVHVKQRLPVDPAKMQAQLADFSKAVRQRRENEAFEIWYNTEASRALRDIPAFRRPANGAAR
jgi:hypothetical protein